LVLKNICQNIVHSVTKTIDINYITFLVGKKLYKNENVMFPHTAVYIIWYGTWTTAAKNIVQNFVTNVGATAWWAINKPYGVGKLTFKSAISDSTYSQGKNLTEPWYVVQNAFNKALLPKDTNGIYLVLSSRY
jgi:hypothetical protein